MGFPVGYTDLFLPKLLLHFLTCLGFIRKFMSTLFRLVGLGDFLDPEFSHDPTRTEPITHFHSVSAVLIRELLPVVKFSDLVDPPESCAVCLYEFEGGDEIRRLTNCRHIFHRCCLDRWMDHDQKTCPLCRTPFIPDDLQDSFNERLWAASGITDYYGDSSLAPLSAAVLLPPTAHSGGPPPSIRPLRPSTTTAAVHHYRCRRPPSSSFSFFSYSSSFLSQPIILSLMSAAVEPSYHDGDGAGDPPDGGNRHPPSGCAASGPKQGRKKTKNISLKKSITKNAKKPLPIEFEKGAKGTYVAVGPNSDNFNTLSGTIVSRIPPYYPSWAKVPPEHTGLIYQELKTYFKMKTHMRGPGSKQLKIGLDKYFAGLYRSQKHKFSHKYFEARGGLDRAEQLREDPPAVMTPEEWRKFVDFKTSPAFQRRSQANKGCRAEQTIVVRHGRKNQAQIRHDNQGKSPIELWKEKRQKDGQFTEPEAAETHAAMKARQDDPNCTLTDFEIMEEVLGERRGWTRGVGPRLPKSAFYEPGTSSTSSQPQQPTFTADQVRTILADYTAPLWQKLGIQPPPLPPQIAGNEDVGEDDDGEDDEYSSSEDDE